MDLPVEIILQICRTDPATGQALHTAYPPLSYYATPAQRQAWYHVTDQKRLPYITTKMSCLRHNYNTTTPFINPIDKSQGWYKFGRRHRSSDQPVNLPAIIYADGTQVWYRNGQFHRKDDQPALIDSDGTQAWYQYGQCHRDGDLPAIIYTDGTQVWYRNGKRHRDGNRPAIIYPDNYQK